MATNLRTNPPAGTHLDPLTRHTVSVTSVSSTTGVRRTADRRDRRRDAEPGAWRRQAMCQGDAATDFYPPFGGERKRDRVAREQRAKAICATCSVSSQCLEQAVATGERYGVWGGLNFEERLSFRRSA